MGFSPDSVGALVTNKKRLAVVLSLFIAAGWFFLWFVPWQAAVHGFSWLRLGIALLVFMTPGIALYALLAEQKSLWIDHITFGFVISHLLIAFLGTLGRIFHLPFQAVINVMMSLGMLLLLLTLYPILSSGLSFRINWTSFKNTASFWTLGLVAVLVALIVIQREFSDDDLSYLAFLTNAQYSAHLNFNDIFFGLSQPVTSRFWLMSVPFAQAFLSHFSGLPGLLILGGYYESFLIVVAILCWYGVARTLRLSHQAASASVILQILSLLLLSEYLHPGAPFFHQLSADKATATFILVPVFIQSEIWLLRTLNAKNAVLFLLCGLSLTFMHPIALAYAVVVGGLLILLGANRENYKARLIPIFIIALTLLPQVILRFVGMRVEENVPYNLDVILNQNGIENMITLWRGTQFYGFNPHVLEMTFPYASRFPILDSWLRWIWLVIPVGALLFAVRKLTKNEIAQYVFSASVLCALAGIPFTGWVIGYFLSAWALERAVWLFPFGLSAVFLLLSVRWDTSIGRRLGDLIKTLESRIRVSNLPMVMIIILTSAVLLLFMREHGLPGFDTFEKNIRRFSDIAQVGAYLDAHSQTQTFAVGSDAINDFIPGVSSQAKVVTFRTTDFFSMSLFPVSEIEQRISDKQAIFSDATSPQMKLGLLRKYDVQFIVLTSADRDLFADLLAAYPSITTMKKVARFFVIQIKDQ